jgi:tetratricopeptide (TPR) repeat protein
MGLQDTTKKIVALVEERTGIPVITTADPSQGTLATVKIARYDAPAHIVTYNPRLGSGLEYGICFQCGLVLRAYAPTEASRFDFGGTCRGGRETEKLVNEHLRTSFSKAGREQLASQFFDGLMLQLRSVAVGLRVDGWLLQDFPELGEQQRAINDRQLKDNRRTLSPEVGRMTPGKILTASVTMSAAFAAFWAKSWSEPVLVAAYRETGNLTDGEALLKLWYDVPQDSDHDKELMAHGARPSASKAGTSCCCSLVCHRRHEMAEYEEEQTYVFSVNDFDKSLLPPHARIPGTDAFREEVSGFIQKDFAEFGGRVRIVVTNETVQVTWSRDPNRPDPMVVVVNKLQRGEHAEAVLILELFRQKRPDDFHVLYNLGAALSDMGQMERAEIHLRRALEVAPENVEAMIALGVALVRQKRDSEATDLFHAAVTIEPENPLALRNLGACLLQDGQGRSMKPSHSFGRPSRRPRRTSRRSSATPKP